jgi:hypothetical protein
MTFGDKHLADRSTADPKETLASLDTPCSGSHQLGNGYLPPFLRTSTNPPSRRIQAPFNASAFW